MSRFTEGHCWFESDESNSPSEPETHQPQKKVVSKAIRKLRDNKVDKIRNFVRGRGTPLPVVEKPVDNTVRINPELKEDKS